MHLRKLWSRIWPLRWAVWPTMAEFARVLGFKENRAAEANRMRGAEQGVRSCGHAGRGSAEGAPGHQVTILQETAKQAETPVHNYTRFGILMIFFWMAYCTSCALL